MQKQLLTYTYETDNEEGISTTENQLQKMKKKGRDEKVTILNNIIYIRKKPKNTLLKHQY